MNVKGIWGDPRLAWLLVITIGIISIVQWVKNKKQRQMIKSLSFYNKTLSRMYDGIRSFKHDFYNFIQALNGYIKCNDMAGVKSMTDSIYQECESVINMEVLNPTRINNPAIYNLIANKYELAYRNHISLRIEVAFDLKELSVNTYQFCRILGILLDNAIEASKNTEEKIIYLRFLKEDDSKILMIENSFANDGIITENLFSLGYTTKENKEDHGLGLWKVKSIVDSMDNLYLDTFVKDSLFVQKLTIQNHAKGFHFSFNRDRILVK